MREHGKEFTFPGRFSKKQCLKQYIRGYSMKSACTPFINCPKKKSKNKSHKSNKKLKDGAVAKKILRDTNSVMFS